MAELLPGSALRLKIAYEIHLEAVPANSASISAPKISHACV
jgi:hypothetical protein